MFISGISKIGGEENEVFYFLFWGVRVVFSCSVSCVTDSMNI